MSGGCRSCGSSVARSSSQAISNRYTNAPPAKSIGQTQNESAPPTPLSGLSVPIRPSEKTSQTSPLSGRLTFVR